MRHHIFHSSMMRYSFVPVSAVIPCYRCYATIGRAVESIAQQSARPAEIILVDDASGDDTLTVLQELAQAYPGWIKILQRDENQGAAGARNAGWEASSQPYIAFLDADDTWHPEKLRIQYEYMHNNPEVAASGHRYVVSRDGGALPDVPLVSAVTRIGPVSLVFRSCFATPTVMLKRDIPFRFPDNRRYSEDLNLWQKIAFSGLPVMRLESQLASIYKAPYGEGGLSAQLWEMEKGELANLAELRRERMIKGPLYAVAVVFSVAKYIKRLLLA